MVSLLIRPLISFRRTLPSWPITSQRPHLLRPLLGIRFLRVNLGIYSTFQVCSNILPLLSLLPGTSPRFSGGLLLFTYQASEQLSPFGDSLFTFRKKIVSLIPAICHITPLFLTPYSQILLFIYLFTMLFASILCNVKFPERSCLLLYPKSLKHDLAHSRHWLNEETTPFTVRHKA